jgi:hypothetical protein
MMTIREISEITDAAGVLIDQFGGILKASSRASTAGAGLLQTTIGSAVFPRTLNLKLAPRFAFAVRSQEAGKPSHLAQFGPIPLALRVKSWVQGSLG